MPTLSTAEYPKPNSWEEFEDLCLSAFKLRWGNPNLERHGRQGQAQQGVDIYGFDELQSFSGIQCKKTQSTISIKLIKEEIDEAEKFDTPISALFIATTMERDANLQKFVRKISADRQNQDKFSVALIFWSDIIHDLARDRSVLLKYYDSFKSDSSLNKTDDIKRKRDITHLTRLLNCIDIDSTVSYLKYGPKYIELSFMETVENFRQVTRGQLFKIHDEKLNQNLTKWLASWEELYNLIISAPYEPTHFGNRLSFKMKMDICICKEDDEKFESIILAIDEFLEMQNDFCLFIEENYLEIDLLETSKNARQYY